MKRAAAALFAATILTPAAAMAEVNLDIGGFFRGYAVYADNDEEPPVPPLFGTREFDFRRDTEIHLSGETTTDGGQTLGFHFEQDIGGAVQADEAYLYFSGKWGRINFGSEDGAAYLLQVGAPSADSNVDGMRAYINGITVNPFLGLVHAGLGLAGAIPTPVALDYDHADFSDTDRLTYLTPKWNGFQAGVSYAPEAGQNAVGNNIAGMAADDDLNDFKDLWEVAARWDGEFEGFTVSIGAGYSDSEEELGAPAPAFADGLRSWNTGVNVSYGDFSAGGSYKETRSRVSAGGLIVDADYDTWAAGLGWDSGPYHLGASYVDMEGTNDFSIFTFDAHRLTVGGGYAYGDGATLRATASKGQSELNFTPVRNHLQFTLGTDVQF